MAYRQDLTDGYAYVNGARIAYDVVGDGHPSVPLVLIHAGIADMRMWDDLVPVSARWYRTLRYDLRGFGRSDMPPARTPTPTTSRPFWPTSRSSVPTCSASSWAGRSPSTSRWSIPTGSPHSSPRALKAVRKGFTSRFTQYGDNGRRAGRARGPRVCAGDGSCSGRPTARWKRRGMYRRGSCAGCARSTRSSAPRSSGAVRCGLQTRPSSGRVLVGAQPASASTRPLDDLRAPAERLPHPRLQRST